MANSPLQLKHIKNLEWAISLCRTNLNECTDGDRLKIKESLHNFVYWADDEFKMTREVSTKELEDFYQNRPSGDYFFPHMPYADFLQFVTPEMMGEVQSNFRDILNRVVSNLPGQVWGAGGRRFTVIVSKHHSGRFIRFFWPDITTKEEHVVSISEYSLIEHLLESGITTDQIRSCPRCHSLFLSLRKVREDRQRTAHMGAVQVKLRREPTGKGEGKS